MGNSLIKQEGAVLVLALVLMLLTGLVASTVMRTSVVEVKMVSNSQLKEEAFQRVDSVVTAVASSKNNFIVAGDVGYRNCASGVSAGGCNVSSVSVPSQISTVPTDTELNFYVDRKGPLVTSLPFRESDSVASGANNFDVALFEVVAEFDGRDERLGMYEVWQGVAVKVAASHQ